MAIPVDFSSEQRADLREAAHRAGICIKSFVSEPTAAYVKCRDELAGASNVAVFDWGGGTLDISLISIENREVSELAVAGMRLGGNDIDQMLARHIHAKIMRQVSTACPFDDLSPKERDGLLDRAEAAKKRLSSDESAPVMLIKYAGRPTVRENVTLDEFSKLIDAKVNEAIQLLFSAADKAGVALGQMDAILMVGGSCEMQAIYQRIEEIGEEYHLAVCRPERVQWSVAGGAAILCEKEPVYKLCSAFGVLLSDDSFYPVFLPGQEAPCKSHELGELRTSQLITSYGVGTIVDFKEETAIIGGADDWKPADEDDPRILHCHSLEKVLQRAYFVKPKYDKKNRAIYEKSYSRDIRAYRFPEILYCPACTYLWKDKQLAGLQKGELRCPECNHRLVPSRFIVACRHGHIDDFPYSRWVHRGAACEKNQGGEPERLKLFNINGRTNLGSLMVSCELCGKTRSMQEAFVPGALAAVYKCAGRQPWLEHDADSPCTENAVARMRTSAGVYMPVNISALNIPPWSTQVNKILFRHLDAMEGKSDEALQSYIERKIRPYLPKISNKQILDAYRVLCTEQNKPHPASLRELYEEEYRALCEETEDENADFSSRRISPPKKYHMLLDSVTAVDCLTEIVTMVGFTRLQGWDGDMNSPCLAPIFSRKQQQWLPAIDMHGEGIFIRLNEEKVSDWEKQNQHIYQLMMERIQENKIHCENASPRYVLLHTFSHLLIRSLAKMCGYQSASLKERIYSTYPSGENMAGILIYTASSDVEGSLGGLVAQANRSIWRR